MRASLSIFTGPTVESSFSNMSDIIDSQSSRTGIDTYSAIMTVKYQLKSAGMTASGKFHRKDILRDPVDRTACSWYKKRLSTKTRSNVTATKEINNKEKS